MGDPALSWDKIDKIRRLYREEDMSGRKVADEVDVNPKTAYKYGKMDDEEYQRLRESSSSSEVKSKGESSVTKPTTLLNRITKEGINEQAAAIYSDLIMYGEFVRDKVVPVAEEMGTTPLTFIKEAVAFYIENRNYVKKLEVQRDVLKRLVKQSMDKLKHAGTNKDKLERARAGLIASKYTGNGVDESLVKEYTQALMEA